MVGVIFLNDFYSEISLFRYLRRKLIIINTTDQLRNLYTDRLILIAFVHKVHDHSYTSYYHNK